MKIELPLTVTYLNHEDENKAKILLVLIRRKLREPEYNKKLQIVIDEALKEVKKELHYPLPVL